MDYSWERPLSSFFFAVVVTNAQYLAHLHIHVCGYMQVCIWGPRENLGCHFLRYCWLAWSSPISLGWLTSECQRPICLSAPGTGIKVHATTAGFFMHLLGLELRSPCTQSKDSTNQALSLAPPVYFLSHCLIEWYNYRMKDACVQLPNYLAVCSVLIGRQRAMFPSRWQGNGRQVAWAEDCRPWGEREGEAEQLGKILAMGMKWVWPAHLTGA